MQCPPLIIAIKIFLYENISVLLLLTIMELSSKGTILTAKLF